MPCRGKKITCPGARDKLNFKQDKHIFSPNVLRTSKKYTDNLFFLDKDKLFGNRTSKNFDVLARGTSENFLIFLPLPWTIILLKVTIKSYHLFYTHTLFRNICMRVDSYIKLYHFVTCISIDLNFNYRKKNDYKFSKWNVRMFLHLFVMMRVWIRLININALSLSMLKFSSIITHIVI